MQNEHIEESIWVSIRMLEEKVNMLKVMANRDPENGISRPISAYQRRIDGTNKHIDQLKSLLMKLHTALQLNEHKE
jgi:two-component system chemotaxis response regulator CheB